MPYRKQVLWIMIAFSLIAQHSAKAQSNRLTQEQMVTILVDLELAKAIVYQDIDQPTPQEIMLFEEQATLIYESHSIDATAFQKSYMTYLTDSKNLIALYDELIQRLEKLFHVKNDL